MGSRTDKSLVRRPPHRWGRRAVFSAVAVAAGVLAGGCATATNSLHPEKEAVKTAHVAELGPVLVDEGGKTLYMFASDPRSDSSCYGACLSVWPPVLTDGKPTAEAGAATAKLSTFKRDDGGTQVTYDGHPLYYYQADTHPGEASGEGLKQFGAEWYALSPAGKVVEGGGS